MEVRVWDSTAELRYIVLPERPAGTENLSEEELAALVTRDAMVGVSKVPAPGGKGMNGVHDMGGLQDMGPVQHEKDEPVFHARLGRAHLWDRPCARGSWASGTWMRGVIKSNCFRRPTTCA